MNTEEYRLAPSNMGPLAATWKDKPHRLVYDLCSEVGCLQSKLEVAEINQDRYRKLIRGESNYLKLLIHRDKYGDYYLLVPSKEDELYAWLLMFRRIDEACGYYDETGMDTDELNLYRAAKEGVGTAARKFLILRGQYEYEYVYIQSIDTALSLCKKLDKLH